MKSVTHQSTLHLSFKIKCCVDWLRPPKKARHARGPERMTVIDPLLTWLFELARLVVPSADAMEVEHEVLADIRDA